MQHNHYSFIDDFQPVHLIYSAFYLFGCFSYFILLHNRTLKKFYIFFCFFFYLSSISLLWKAEKQQQTKTWAPPGGQELTVQPEGRWQADSLSVIESSCRSFNNRKTRDLTSDPRFRADRQEGSPHHRDRDRDPLQTWSRVFGSEGSSDSHLQFTFTFC